jgi:hypothetical protein
VPDFEIRYFHFDGTLALVHVTSHETHSEAETHARLNQHPHDRFEVQEVKGRRPSWQGA